MMQRHNSRTQWPKGWTPVMLGLLLSLIAVHHGLAAGGGAPEAPSEKDVAEAPGAGHGEASEESGEQGKAAAEPTPETKVYKLAEPLENRFDLSVLRVGRKTSDLRFPVGPIISSVPSSRNRNMRVSLNLVLEFGRESGMAEADLRQEEILDICRRVVARFSVEELESTEGKLRLKEMVALDLNRRFKTAQVRKVYYMMFHISPNR